MTFANLLAAKAPLSTRSAAARRTRNWVAGSSLALASLLVSTALWATGSTQPDFECRRAARLVYKVEANQCGSLDTTAGRTCIREARAAYRAHKRTCGVD